ncbi:MAG: hypothetical protein WAT81_04015, partial [Candidatus Moraniibacteriota bacterium]
PWLLRRYAFTLFPFFLLATIVLWESWEEALPEAKKKLAGFALFFLLFGSQLYPAYQALSVIEYSTLREQASAFGAQFSDEDLILINRGATGDPFAMIAGPLAAIDRKNAVYFFNPQDYARLDRNAVEHVYLLTTEDSLGRYAEIFGDTLLPVEVRSFSFPILTVTKAFAWPEQSKTESDAILFEIND